MNRKVKKQVKVRIVKNNSATAEKSPYLARVIPDGSFGLDDLLKELSETAGVSIERARLIHTAFWENVVKALRAGYKVDTPLGRFELCVDGSVPYADSPLDPEKNKVYVKITPAKSLRVAAAELEPVVVNAPTSGLMIGEVLTSALGEKGYNVVKQDEPFVLTGNGFLEDGSLAVTLKDAKGVIHPVTVVSRKKTALVCRLSEVAAKGKAMVEVVLSSEEPAPTRFAASRKVKSA